MKTILVILSVLFATNMNAQVCCSPIGNGQAGGGASMNNWAEQWPNSLIGDHRWHWMIDLQVNERGRAGNILYGPQTTLVAEISKSVGLRNILFLSGAGNWGTIEERVTYQNVSTSAYSGSGSFGIRRALGKQGRNWVQIQLILPGKSNYLDDTFPFDSEESVKGEVLMLHNQPMPWSGLKPEFFATVSISGAYQKNAQKRDNIYSDHKFITHVSSAIHQWYPLFFAPFVQVQAEQLLAPPSVWTTERETRILASSSIGFDLAVAKPPWDIIKLRIGVPIYAKSSQNGFPDGTQPSAYVLLAINHGGILGTRK